LVAVFFAAISAFRAHRVRAANDEAAKYAPTDSSLVFLPAGTAIHAVFPRLLADFSTPGDSVRAIVSEPVMIEGRHVLAPGAELKGTLERFSQSDSMVRVSMNFRTLIVGVHAIPIEARRVDAVTSVQNDAEILSSAFKTLMGASIGAAVAAGAGDRDLIDRGLLEGIRATQERSELQFTVILSRDAAFCR
jgi:hypothetical protein